MVSRFLPRWRSAPGPIVVSLATYVFLILALFALAAQATGRLAGLVAHLAPALTTSAKPAPGPAGQRSAVPQTAAMSVPLARGQGSVVLTQGWSGFPGYRRDRSDWRERERNRDAWSGRDRDDEERRRWRDSDEDDNEDRRPRQSYGNTYRTVCVRLCDGYYWPMSYATSADNLGRDRQKCSSSCGSPARLITAEHRAPRQTIWKTSTASRITVSRRLSFIARNTNRPASARRSPGRRRQPIATKCTPWKRLRRRAIKWQRRSSSR